MKTEELTQQRREDNQNAGKLLSLEEREVFKQLACGEAPWCQRALALLALDQGVTQVEAGELSGLTLGQVRYWRDKFRQQRLGIFPGDPSDEPAEDSRSVSAEDRPQRDSKRETAIAAGQPKAESNQEAKKKNSAAPRGGDKTPKKAKRIKGKKKKDKKKAEKKQSKKKKQKKKNEIEIKSGKKAKKPGRDRKKTKKKTETTKKGKKSSKKGKK